MENGLWLKIVEFGWEIFAGIAWGVYHLVSVRKKATGTQIDKLTDTLANEKTAREKEDARIFDRLRTVENKIVHLPTKDDFQELEVQMAVLTEQMVAMTKALEAVSKTTLSIQEYLLDKKL